MGKTFTHEEANRALVFVAPVVKEIQGIWNALMTLTDHKKVMEPAIREKLERMKYCMHELEQVGCVVRDPIKGILDFPSFYKGEPVFMCWHLGEEQLDYWHLVKNGYSERQPVDEEFIAWNSNTPMPKTYA